MEQFSITASMVMSGSILVLWLIFISFDSMYNEKYRKIMLQDAFIDFIYFVTCFMITIALYRINVIPKNDSVSSISSLGFIITSMGTAKYFINSVGRGIAIFIYKTVHRKNDGV